MGNCQAIDAASLVIQHPSGKVDKMYWNVAASEIMKMNPGYYVALLITTTICHPTSSPKIENSPPTKLTSKNDSNINNGSTKNNSNTEKNNTKKNSNNKSSDSKNSSTSNNNGSIEGRNSVRITRVKLLRPTDTLTLGHVYRLISTKEVMKGLVAKKQAKMRKNGIELADSEALREAEILVRKSHQDKTHQVNRHGHRSRTPTNTSGGTARPKTWQPSLNSISEAAS